MRAQIVRAALGNQSLADRIPGVAPNDLRDKHRIGATASLCRRSIYHNYDDNNNLKTRIDARNIKTDYDYDALDRVIKRSYSVIGNTPPNYVPAPALEHFYDGTGTPAGVTPGNAKGRLTAVKSSVVENYNADFDVMGRVRREIQIIDPQATNPKSYELNYEYSVGGQMTVEHYPSGRTVNVDYDAANRITGVFGSSYYAGGPANSPDAIKYTAHGMPEAVRLGNGLWESTIFNLRQQATDVSLGTSVSDSSKLHLSYTFGLVIDGTLDATKNNANLQSQTITAPGINVTQSYEYDYLNRLRSAEEKNGGSQNWKQVFKYDLYGNRNFDEGTTTTSLTSPLTNPKISQANYHIDNAEPGQTNVVYDAGGNLTRTVDNQTFDYDSENRQVNYNQGNPSSGGASYYYDGDGRRVKKVTADGTTIFVYDIQGKLVAEYSDAAQAEPVGTSYVSSDILGTPRAITDLSGNVSRHDYYPYGEEITRTVSGYNGSDRLRHKFTGKERDSETNLDFFGARYYSPTMGRFTSPDEFNGWPSEVFAASAASNPTFYADLINPQTLNKYAYANNNPFRYIDPNGHDGFFSYLGNWFARQVDPEDQSRASTATGPLGVDPSSYAAFWGFNVANNINTAGELFEDMNLDFGVMDASRQTVNMMLKKDPGVFDYAKFTYSYAKVGANIAAIGGLGVEGFAVESPMARVVPEPLWEARVSEKGLDLVENHLARFGPDEANTAMLNRLKDALAANERVVGADANFYLHETYEGTLMNKGMTWDVAHPMALERYGVSQPGLYHPSVVNELHASQGMFSPEYLKYWGTQ